MSKTSTDGLSALIVARPGRLRDGLQAMMRVVPQIGGVNQAGDGLSALSVIAEHHPPLVLLDADLPGDAVWDVLRQIKAEWSEILCILVVSTCQQREAARAGGADAVLVKGFTTRTLGESIARLLPSTGKTPRAD